jgi:hypothetical protein
MRLPGLFCLATAGAALGCGGGTPTAGPRPTPAATAATDTAAMTRIRFARGTTSGILNDSLPAGGERAYLIGALQGQVMLAHAIAWSDRRSPGQGETSVRVYRADGGELRAPVGGAALWSGRLPADGDYVVRVRASGGPTAYTLAVQIPKPVVANREHPSAFYAGVAPSRAPVDFLIDGEQGTTLDVALRTDPGSHLHIYGLDDGIQLARLADRKARFTGVLPATQQYVISVVPAGEGTRYELTIAVTPR